MEQNMNALRDYFAEGARLEREGLRFQRVGRDYSFIRKIISNGKDVIEAVLTPSLPENDSWYVVKIMTGNGPRDTGVAVRGSVEGLDRPGFLKLCTLLREVDSP